VIKEFKTLNFDVYLKNHKYIGNQTFTQKPRQVFLSIYYLFSQDCTNIVSGICFAFEFQYDVKFLFSQNALKVILWLFLVPF
jgi:hypothetical protein